MVDTPVKSKETKSPEIIKDPKESDVSDESNEFDASNKTVEAAKVKKPYKLKTFVTLKEPKSPEKLNEGEFEKSAVETP
jgi:hypothetical protein